MKRPTAEMSDAKSEPTARPWQVVRNHGAYVKAPELAVYRIDTAPESGRDMALALVITDTPELNNKTNAQFIVRAVNAHDALLEALKAARDYLYDVGRDTDMAPTMDKIEAAINLAEGL
jgi:hypothetical protein